MNSSGPVAFPLSLSEVSALRNWDGGGRGSGGAHCEACGIPGRSGMRWGTKVGDPWEDRGAHAVTGFIWGRETRI